MSIAAAAGGAAKALEQIIADRRMQQALEAEIKNREATLAESQRSSLAAEAARQRELDIQQQHYTAEDAARQREREETQGMQAFTLSGPGRIEPQVASVIQKNPVAARLLKVRQALPETEGVGPLQEPEIQRPELPAERQQRTTNERLLDAQRLTDEERKADNERQRLRDEEQQRQFGVTSGETRRYHGILAGAEQDRRRNKPSTGLEKAALGYYNRMLDADQTMTAVEDQVSAKDLALINSSPLPELINNPLLSAAGQQYAQALKTYTEARLRKESGAAIPPHEYAADRQAISRQVGDQPETIQQKRRTRKLTAKGIGFAAGRAYEEYYGEPMNLTDSEPATAGASGPAVGTTRTINGQPAYWDGNGWLPGKPPGR